MLEHVNLSIGHMFGIVGGLGSFLSFVLSIYLEWGNIKARIKSRTRRVKEQAPLSRQAASQSIAETKPTLRAPVGGYLAPKSPRLDIARLIGNLFLDLVKTMFAIFMAIVVSAEYMLFGDYYLGLGLPYEWLLITSLALGSILGAYLRVRSWFFVLLVSAVSQIGILYLNGWSLQDLLARLEGFVMSGLVASL